MLTYTFPQNLNKPMYLYLYENIKKDIINQTLKPNEKLPSKRTFAKNLDVSIITVENAYNQLLLEGFIYAIEKKGYYVSSLNFPNKPKQYTAIINESNEEYYLIDLKTNSVGEHFPYSTYSKLTRQVLSNQDGSLLTRPPQIGCIQLRQAISKHLYDFNGMNVPPNQIIIGAGSEYLYNLLIQLLGHDVIYALEDPGHQSISKVYDINHIHYHYIPLDKYGIQLEPLQQSSAQIVHISPAHHFPTGITMPIQRRLDLLKWANDHQGYIIEDDYDSEFRLRGKPLSPLYQIDQHDRVIYMNTFSKTLSPSFRMSYMILPQLLMQLFHQKLGFYACSVSSFEQIVVAEFINQGYFEKHINRMRHYYKLLRDDLLSALKNSDIYQDITIKEENSGLHFLLEYHKDISDQQIKEKAKSIGLNISCLSDFYHQPQDLHTLIINYSGLSRDNISLAIQLLTKLIK
ncbi:MAG: PLP-dependent aminotransferase family protein [Erysipelotrichaceae bacterium]|nr:PLP-dependent aminotransferase family protein [Erysipelotrichaceae bacterium]